MSFLMESGRKYCSQCNQLKEKHYNLLEEKNESNILG